MNKLTIFSAVIIAASLGQSVLAQHDHADVEFGYDDTANPTAIEIENDNFSTEGIQFYEAEFELLDDNVPGDFGAPDPGFITAGDEGLLFNTGDNIFLCPLNALTHSSTDLGVGYVNYYNPTTQLLEAANSLAVIDNTPTGTVDLILDGATATGDALQFLGTVDGDGDLHDHVIFDLLNDATAPDGAYGVLFEVHAVQADGSPTIVSDPVWFVFNNNLSEEVFEGAALEAFGIVEAIPEPTSVAFLFGGAACLALRRRR